MLESIKLQIIHADQAGIIFLLGLMVILCAVSLYGIFRFFHRYRMIADTPTSRIRSAHQGYVELEGEGRLMQGQPIISPLSKKKCLWYKFKIEERVREYDIGPSNNHALSKASWETVNSGTSDNLFLLIDDTGTCVVDPEGATVTPSFSKTWYGEREYQVTDMTSVDGILGMLKVGNRNKYRFTEQRIDIGDYLYVLGRFNSIGGRRENFDKKAEVRDLLAKWKKMPDLIRARFDENDDGEIDMHEWQKVVEAAEQRVDKDLTERLVDQEIHTISKPIDSRRPFIISVENQEDIIRKYQRFSIGSLLGFFLSGITFFWVLGIRLAN